MGTDRRHIDFTAKITRKVTEMGPLLDNRTSAEHKCLINAVFDDGKPLPLGHIPPVWLSNRLVRTSITSDGRHDSEAINFENLFHVLNCFQVS
jgi:hypothetical protein